MSLRLSVILILLLLTPMIWAKGIYKTADQFLKEGFPDMVPESQILWINAALKQQISHLLHRPYNRLRVRYWQKDKRSAWIFDETGKEQPITIGVVINGQQIERINILAFHESRGGEIKHRFFTDQFQGIGLTKTHQLSEHIDGITGATLSVTAVKRAARLALFLNQQALAQ